MAKQYKITTFESAKTTGKSPVSPFEDRVSFKFETLVLDDPSIIMNVMTDSFILDIPLNIDEPLIARRRKLDLFKYYSDTIDYIIIDCDHVGSESNRDKIFKYFMQYKCIICESRSYNGIDSFNLKGILFTDIPMNLIKFASQKIHDDLIDLCDFDTSVTRMCALNAPIGKCKVLFDNLKCENVFTQLDIGIVSNTSNLPKEFNKQVTVTDANSLSDLCLKYFQELGFNAIRNGSDGAVIFSHPCEQKSPGGYFWFSDSPFIMHHFNASRNVNIFSKIVELPEAKKFLEKSLNYSKELECSKLKYTDYILENSKYLQLNTKISEAIKKFLERKDGLFKIRSPMGTGKSNIISEIISEASSQDMRILLITNRISVAEDFASKYNLKLYYRDRYKIGDSLICQYDSLWKYNLKYFDLVILDEFISLILHSRTALNNSFVNCAKFFASFNKKLVIADAFLTGYEDCFFGHKSKSENLVFLDNQYRDDVKVYNYCNLNYFILQILKTAESKKCTISSTSLSFIYSMQRLLNDHGVRTCVLTSQTPSATKQLIYSRFKDSDNPYWDVLLYSPTLTVGVSNLNDAPVHFHYDSSMAGNVISSLQMIKRTRKASEIHCFIKNRTNFVKTSYSEIKDFYLSNIGKNVGNNYLFDINDYGEPKLSRLGSKVLYIDLLSNLLEFSHLKVFKFLLKYQFKNPVIDIYSEFESNILHKYSKEIKSEKFGSAKSEIEQYLKLSNVQKLNILENLDANAVLKRIAELDCLEFDSEQNIPDKAKLIELALKDSNFIKHCKYFKLFYSDYSDAYLKSLVSSSIIKNDYEMVQFINKLEAFRSNGNKAKLQYQINEVTGCLDYFIRMCGYKIYNYDVKKYGYRNYEIDRNVLKYYQYVRI